jgi:hypothetical protein
MITRPDRQDGDGLLPCPFCGGPAIFERAGNARQSCIIKCDDCGCKLETNEVFHQGTAWNTRATPASGEAAEGAGEASIPTYGNVPWDQLGRDVMEAVMGSRVDYKFPTDMYPGHDIAHINFNSLARIIDKYRLVPPKPAPDAVREALEPFAKIADIYDRAHEERVRHYADEGRDFGPPQPDHYLVSVSIGECRKARAALAAPVPPADGARLALEHAKTRFGCLADHFRDHGEEALLAMSEVDGERMEKALAGIPSATGAAEPGIADALGWLLDAIKSEGVTPTPLLKRRFEDAEKALLRLAAPPVRGDREVIARIRYEHGHYCLRDVLLEGFQAMKFVQPEKAVDDMLDAILSLPVQPGAGERS